MSEVEPRPWSLGVWFRDPPQGVWRYLIGADAPAQGRAIRDLEVRADTVLHSEDEIVVLIDPDSEHDPTPLFTGR